MSRPLVVRACLSLLVCATFAAVSGVARAQDCGAWREPVLCTGELAVRGEDGRWVRFEPGRGLRISPGAAIELELSGRDQSGRTFPAYRLALDADSRDCGPYVDVEDQGEGRLRLVASRTGGVCRLDVWVPGNLNFAWRIELEVARAPRTGYERGEAEVVARGLYRALLAREGDAGGLSAAIGEIQRGNLEAQIRAMVMSEEFRQKQMALDSEALLAQFYRGLLERDVDSTGIRTFSEDMSFRRYTDVLLAIIRSPEFEERLAPQR